MSDTFSLEVDGPIEISAQTFMRRYLNANDMTALLDLHQLVFGQPLDAPWYEWKYSKRPQAGVGLWSPQGDLIAHCGGVPRTVYVYGKSQAALQICDVMVHPNWRGILTRHGPFYSVSHALYQSQIGLQGPYTMGFGFPSARHLRLAQKLGLLNDAGHMWELAWEKPQATLDWYWQGQELQEGHPLWRQIIDRSWRHMQQESRFLILGARDTLYVRERYLQHPRYQYHFRALKRPWAKYPDGVAVWRYTDAQCKEILWVDWIGPPSLMTKAQRMMSSHAATLQVNRLSAWASATISQVLSQDCQHLASIASCGIVSTTSAINHHALVSAPWWWMAGDTDFL